MAPASSNGFWLIEGSSRLRRLDNQGSTIDEWHAEAEGPRRLAERFLPAPGDGPDARSRERGFFEMFFHAEHPGDTRRHLRARVTGDRDPGYGATLSSNNCPVLSACDDLDGDTTIIESAHPASSARRATGGASCPASKITMRGFGEGVHAGYELLLLLALGWRRQR